MIGLYGKPFITSLLMVEPGEPVEVKRTWRERLFTRPWRPLKATHTVIPEVPMRSVVITPFAYIVHPMFLKELESAMKEAPDENVSRIS